MPPIPSVRAPRPAASASRSTARSRLTGSRGTDRDRHHPYVGAPCRTAIGVMISPDRTDGPRPVDPCPKTSQALKAVAGQRCALNLAGESITKDAISRGDMVLDPELHAPTNRIDVELRLLASEPKPVTQWMPVRLFHASADTAARLVLLDDTAIAPGQAGLVQLVLDQPIAAAAGDRFVLRDTTSQRTVGGGTLLDLRAPARKRRTPERLAQLRAHRIGDPEAALAMMLAIAPRFVELSASARATARAPRRRFRTSSSGCPSSRPANRWTVVCPPCPRRAGWSSSERCSQNCRHSMPTIPTCPASASSGYGCARAAADAGTGAVGAARACVRTAGTSRWTGRAECVFTPAIRGAL